MTLSSVLFNKITFLSIIVLVLGVLLHDRISSVFVSYLQEYSGPGHASVKPTKANLYSLEELSRYNGEDNAALYLAILGVVFDVSAGRKHYAEGASYHYFVGKDGSRSFITGNFSDESSDQDHVIDLKCDELDMLLNWRDTFRKRYISKGKLIGRYFDQEGSPTTYYKELKSKIKQCKHEKQLEEETKQQYPPCNMEWTAGEGTRVWCSKNSGGITRNWVGVPRQLFTPGQEKPQCVCLNMNKDHSGALLKEYEDCSVAAVSCNVKDSE